ncbi:hypothetical protein KC354_g98 [Hortaea werneckii]|nr:hypothetical protein KC354_g98 [Hortaea werneckii]
MIILTTAGTGSQLVSTIPTAAWVRLTIQLIPSQLDIIASSFMGEIVCRKVTTRQHRLGSKITLRASLAS